MKLMLLVIGLLPSLCFSDVIQWQDDENGQYVEKMDSQSTADSKGKPYVDTQVSADRQDLYLDTLQRLEQIDAINKLPATAAGGAADSKRSCSYAKNVLLEYKLELKHVATVGTSQPTQRDIKAKIADWESHVKSHCR